MTATLSEATVLAWLSRSATVLHEQRDFLVELDSEIGDADHGINMDRGFQKVASLLPGLAHEDISAILKKTGMALISTVGGASGPLYGTFFLRAANAASGKQELEHADVVALLRAGIEGIRTLGKAQPGDKTMVDSLQPALEALEQAEANSMALPGALRKAVQAAKEGMTATVAMIARKGRASYLGERSAGHQDPGATSAYFLLKSLLDVFEEQTGKET